MSISQRLNKIQMLLQVADSNLISKIELVIRNHRTSKSSQQDELPDVAKQLLDQSQLEVENGQVRSSNDVISEARKKYNSSGNK